MDGPLISVVMPTYNNGRYIKKAIESVFCQAVSLELIVINDASLDDTIEVIAEYQAREDFIFINNEGNLGVARSRNIGVQRARGEFVAFLDADDWWAEDKLKLQLEAIDKTGAVLCSTAREIVTPNGNLTGKVIGVKEHITYQMMLYQNWLNCSAVLVRSAVIKEFPMQHDKSHEDYITWMRILAKYKVAAGINEPLLKYRLSENGKSGSKFQSARMMYQAYRHLGFGYVKAMFCFCAYAINGVRKYYLN
jgi:Glycosyltransferases involved in cell wall biogenesis